MQTNQKIFIAIGSFAGIAIAFSVIVVYPIFQGISKDHNAVIEQKRALAQMNENRMRSYEFERISEEYAEEFSRVEDLFIDSETPVSFFLFLEDTAALFELQVEKNPGNIQQAEGDAWRSFEMRLMGEGLYSNFLAFLQKIENAPYLIEVKTLTITGNESLLNEQPSGHIEFSLSLKVFTR